MRLKSIRVRLLGKWPRLGYLGIGWLGLGAVAAQAQIIPDGTLSTQVNTTDNLNFMVEGGDIAGTNLFHSFGEFSVPTDGSAIFNNGLDIENIFSRVTGTNFSNIDGLIQANGTANFFLLNPNGIQFGSDASLDLGGSFFGSTSDSLVFEDGTPFNTADTSTAPMLSVSVPTGVQWNQPSPNPIALQNASLAVTTGETLTFLGGELNLNASRLTAPDGRVNLGGLSASGTVSLEGGLSPVITDGVTRSAVSLSDGSKVDVTGSGTGQIVLYASDLTLSESELLAGLASGLGSEQTVAGNILLDVTNHTSLEVGSLIANDVATGAIGNGGNILFTTGSLTLLDGSRVQTVTNSTGAAGGITLEAQGDIEIAGFTEDGLFSGLLSRSATETSGAGGNITVNAPKSSLTLANQGFIGAVTDSSNIGGDIDVNTRTLAIETGGQLVTATTSLGNAGDITVNATENISISGKSPNFLSSPFLDLAVFDLNTLEFITDANANVAESGANGIPYVSLERTPEQIISGTMLLGAATDGVDYYSFSVTEGGSRVILDIDNGFTRSVGNIDTTISLFNLATGELVEFNDDEFSSAGGEGSIPAFGPFGADSFIDTTLSEAGFYVVGVGAYPSRAIDNQLVEGASPQIGDTYTLHVSLENQGTAGLPSLDNLFQLDGNNPNVEANSGIFSSSLGSGNGGNLTINTPNLTVSQAGRMATDALAEGNGGTLQLNVADAIVLSEGADVSSLARSTGNSGNIFIETGQLTLTDESFLRANTFATGQAGNIDILAREVVQVSTSSEVRSNVSVGATGNGGNIAIETPTLEVVDTGRVSAIAEGNGNAGNISIQADDITVSGWTDEGFLNFSLIAADSRGSGSGGTIEIDTERLTVSEAAEIRVLSGGSGAGGSVTIRATDFVEIYSGTYEGGTILSSSAVSFGEPDIDEVNTRDLNGGDLTVITDQLRIAQGGLILAFTDSASNAGSITIQADSIEIDGSGAGESRTGIAAVVQGEDTTGNGGSITIEGEQLRITNGGGINVSTFGAGDAGSIVLDVDYIEVRGLSVSDDGDLFSRIEASSETEAAAGSVDITTNVLQVSDSGTIAVSSLGGGNAGSLNILANQVRLSDGGNLRAEIIDGNTSLSDVEGDIDDISSFTAADRIDSGQGSIFLTINNLLMMTDNALISAEATGSASGGNLTINAPLIVGLNNSDIVANAVQGNGGNIVITTQGILGFEFRDGLTSESDITASSEYGVNGTVEITNPNVAVDSGLVELPTGLVDASSQVAKSCGEDSGSAFVASGRGGVAANPAERVEGIRPWADIRALSALSSNTGNVASDSAIVSSTPTFHAESASETAPTEANAWHINAAGQVELAARQASQLNPHNQVTCLSAS